MNKSKKQFLSFLLSFTLAVTMFVMAPLAAGAGEQPGDPLEPVEALIEDEAVEEPVDEPEASAEIAGFDTDGIRPLASTTERLDFVNDITVSDSGDGWDWDADGKVLTLDGIDLEYDASGDGYEAAIQLPGDSTIKLFNENSVVNIGDGICAEGDLTIMGSGRLSVSADQGDGIVAFAGDIEISGVELDIYASKREAEPLGLGGIGLVHTLAAMLISAADRLISSRIIGEYLRLMISL